MQYVLIPEELGLMKEHKKYSSQEIIGIAHNSEDSVWVYCHLKKSPAHFHKTFSQDISTLSALFFDDYPCTSADLSGAILKLLLLHYHEIIDLSLLIAIIITASLHLRFRLQCVTNNSRALQSSLCYPFWRLCVTFSTGFLFPKRIQ